MNAPETPPRAAPDGADEPVFDAPWQAHAFAMTLMLHQEGLFSWSEWTERLGAALAAGDHEDGNEGYYAAWLETLEAIVEEKRLLKAGEFAARYEAWASAARNTPHGIPIELKNADSR